MGKWLAYAVQRVPELHEKIENGLPLLTAGGSAGGVKAVLWPESERNVAPIESTTQSLQDSSLPKKNAFQTPQLFDYRRSTVKEIIIED
jgi:hypothetical protein